jgi:phosphomannomutase/phosphoglucomutase
MNDYTPVSFNPSIFREYDIRGIADDDLTDDVVEAIGRAYGTMLTRDGRQRISLGRDCRVSSERIGAALTRGLLAAGIRVTDIGTCTTPLLYYSIHKLDKDGGVMVTGSHNPPEFNGMKLCVGTSTLHGDQIQEVRRVIEGGDLASGTGAVDNHDIIPEYLDELAGAFSFERRMKVVVDAGNGTGGLVAPELFKRLGCDVVELYCDVDGSFPNHHPDPTVEKNLVELRQRVVEEKADLGLAYDGDADRIGAVDEQGGIIWGDKLLILYAREILSRKPGATIISEVKASTTLYDDIKAHGGDPVMWKTGHSLIKAKMKETGAELAGELSGHMFFKDGYYGFDDAVYASCRLIDIAASSTVPLTAMLADVPKTVSTPEIRVDCPDEEKFPLIERLKERLSADHEIIDVDGVRVVFPDGWALARASNTQPVLVLRFEALTEERLQEMRDLVEGAIEAVKR